MGLDLPFPRGWSDKNLNPGTHRDCDHEQCRTDGSHAGWCQHWVTVHYGIPDGPWDGKSWREQLEVVLPGIDFIFTGVEWSPCEVRKCWLYLIYLRVDPLSHRVDRDMLCALRHLGDGKPGMYCLEARPFPLCCSMRRRRGRNLENLYMACHEDDDMLLGPTGPRVMFGDEFARLLLKQIWRTVDARIAQVEAEEAAEKMEKDRRDARSCIVE